jgi:hypothetical protein
MKPEIESELRSELANLMEQSDELLARLGRVRERIQEVLHALGVAHLIAR